MHGKPSRRILLSSIALFGLWFVPLSQVSGQVQPAERLNGVAGHANSLSWGPVEIAMLIGIPLSLILAFVLVGRDEK